MRARKMKNIRTGEYRKKNYSIQYKTDIARIIQEFLKGTEYKILMNPRPRPRYYPAMEIFGKNFDHLCYLFIDKSMSSTEQATGRNSLELHYMKLGDSLVSPGTKGLLDCLEKLESKYTTLGLQGVGS